MHGLIFETSVWLLASSCSYWGDGEGVMDGFFQGVMERVGEGSCRIGASHTISTTSILSNHSSTLVLPSTQNSEKSEKSNCFFPSYESKSSLPTTCTQFTTNSIPIHYINSHLKIQLLWRHFETPLLLPFYFILMDTLPRLYSIALSFHFVVWLPKNHPFFISMAPFLLLSSFIHPLFIILLHIFTNLSSVLFVPAFSYHSLI